VTYRPVPVPPGAVPAPAIEAWLEPDAIGVVQDTVIGMASSAPAATLAAVGALIVAATWAYILATSAQAIFGEVVSLAGLLAVRVWNRTLGRAVPAMS
jgi:hypothetical protein